MRKTSRKISMLAVLAVLGGMTVVAPPASAQTTYEIRIGTTRLPDNRNAASMRFFPSRITVHQGDSLHFVTGALHTATLLPTGEDAQDWVDTNATEQDQPFSAITNDPDDGAGALKLNAGAFVSNRTDCGMFGDGSPCDFDGTSVLNSGAAIFPGQQFDFTAVVDVPAGESFWVVCLVHPDMRMKVTVVPGTDPTTQQSDIDAQRANQIARDNDWALATDSRLERQTSHRTASGRTVRDVFQGFDNQFASLNETYPKRINIRRGQRVRFHFDNLNFEAHSATFPPDFGRWFGQIETFNPVCDPDGDAGPGPDTPPGDPSDPPNVCPGGPSQLEQDFEARSGQGAGNGVVSNRTGLENSGIRGVPTQRFESFDVRFMRRSGDDRFRFFCFFHGGAMVTRIRVR
jgi:plastocyanin